MSGTYTVNCLQCGAPIEARYGRKAPGLCSEDCRRARRALQAAGKPVPMPPPEEPLGPEVPLDGISDEARMRRRDERILRVIREGVPTDAIAERFDVSADVVRDVAARVGVSMRERFQDMLPFGVPA